MIYNLHLLRALAAAMVVAHHLRDGLDRVFAGIEHVIVGAAGVDIFFVVSGVVITLAAHAGQGSAVAFFSRRAVRVVPMYWLALMLIGIMLVAGLSPLGVQAEDATVENMLRSMFFVPFERVHGVIMPLLGVGWTLNYEMFFYAIFAMLMVLAPNHRAIGLILIMVMLTVSGLVFQPVGVISEFYTNAILLEFAAGVVLAQIWVRWDGATTYDLVVGCLLLTIGIALLLEHSQYDGFDQLMPSRAFVFGLPATCCVAGAMLLERAGFVVKAPIMMQLGAASYALYLFHPIVLQCLARTGLTGETPIGAAGYAVFAFVMCHLTAVVVHRHIERPLTAFLRSGIFATRAA